MLQSLANNYGAFVSTVPKFLNLVDFAHRLVGPKPLEYLSGTMNRMSNHLVPTWNPYMPRVRLCHLHLTPCSTHADIFQGLLANSLAAHFSLTSFTSM